jgi:hypothetical protein
MVIILWIGSYEQGLAAEYKGLENISRVAYEAL